MDTGPNDTEYTDPDIFSSGDRSFLMGSGPFTMAPGDSQEIIHGIINAAAGSSLDSYLWLKEIDLKVQNFVNNQFQTIEPPPTPEVCATSLDDQIIITWDNFAETYVKDDNISVPLYPYGEEKYRFEGYNVYQLDSPDGIGELKRIATYDIINNVGEIEDDIFDEKYGVYVKIIKQYGTDSGLRHDIQITSDALNNYSPLLLNREYYFGITSYAHNHNGYPKSLESELSIVSVRPQVPNTWTANSDSIKYGSQLIADHPYGNGAGSVKVNIIDPTKINGSDYKLTFNDIFIDGADTLFLTNWNVINTSTNEILLENQLVIDGVDGLSGDSLGNDSYPIVEGLQFTVNNPKPDIDYVAIVANANGPLSTPTDALPYWRYPDWLYGLGEYEYAQVTDAVWMLNTHPTYGPAGPETFYNSVVFYSGGADSKKQGLASLVPNNFECRFTGEGKAYDYWDGTGIHDVSFEWWNIGPDLPNNTSDDYKLISYYLDDDGNGEWGLTPSDHESSGADNDPYTDRIYVMSPTNNTPGTEGHNDFFANVLPDGSNVAQWTSAPGDNDPGGPMDTWNVFSRLIFMNWNGGDINDPTFPVNVNSLEPEIGTIFRIVTTKPLSSEDEFIFSTASLIGKTLVYEPNNIKVWPNPYFAQNPEESGTNDRQIHFTNLPKNGVCIIRIFDLVGNTVRKIDHTNGTQFEIWDIRDHNSNLVSSGMYIVHIETDKGEKVLKLAIIQSSN